MGRYIWPAVIGAIAAVLVAVIQYVVAPLVTQAQLKAAVEAAKPTWKTFPELNTKKQGDAQTLGTWNVCTLTTAGAVHHTQACTCELKPTQSSSTVPEWTLKVLLDPNVDGFCRCQASCFNFK